MSNLITNDNIDNFIKDAELEIRNITNLTVPLPHELRAFMVSATLLELVKYLKTELDDCKKYKHYHDPDTQVNVHNVEGN